jgi:hypothetical protein
MSPVLSSIIQGVSALLLLGGALSFIEWKEKRDARRHELDLERIRSDKEIARLRAEVERLRKAAEPAWIEAIRKKDADEAKGVQS